MIERSNATLNLVPTTERRIARFSDCEKYRYTLEITWNEDLPVIQVIGLNPSIADEMRDDRTVAKLKKLSKRWGYGTLVMTNLFAYRATFPEDMKAQEEPVGSDNDGAIAETSRSASCVLCAWGCHGTHLNRDKAVLNLIGLNRGFHHLKLTKEGHPSHPLYLPESLVPKLWDNPLGRGKTK